MAKPPHTRGEMRAFYPVCQVAELAAGYRDTSDETDAWDILPGRVSTGDTPPRHQGQEKGKAVYAELRHRVWAPPGWHLRVRAGPGSAAALAGARHRSRDGDALWPRGHGGGPPGLWAAHDLRRASRGGGGASACLAAAAPAQAGPRGPAPAQAPVTAGREALLAPEGRCHAEGGRAAVSQGSRPRRSVRRVIPYRRHSHG